MHRRVIFLNLIRHRSAGPLPRTNTPVMYTYIEPCPKLPGRRGYSHRRSRERIFSYFPMITGRPPPPWRSPALCIPGELRANLRPPPPLCTYCSGLASFQLRLFILPPGAPAPGIVCTRPLCAGARSFSAARSPNVFRAGVFRALSRCESSRA